MGWNIELTSEDKRQLYAQGVAQELIDNAGSSEDGQYYVNSKRIVGLNSESVRRLDTYHVFLRGDMEKGEYRDIREFFRDIVFYTVGKYLDKYGGDVSKFWEKFQDALLKRSFGLDDGAKKLIGLSVDETPWEYFEKSEYYNEAVAEIDLLVARVQSIEAEAKIVREAADAQAEQERIRQEAEEAEEEAKREREARALERQNLEFINKIKVHLGNDQVALNWDDIDLETDTFEEIVETVGSMWAFARGDKVSDEQLFEEIEQVTGVTLSDAQRAEYADDARDGRLNAEAEARAEEADRKRAEREAVEAARNQKRAAAVNAISRQLDDLDDI